MPFELLRIFHEGFKIRIYRIPEGFSFMEFNGIQIALITKSNNYFRNALGKVQYEDLKQFLRPIGTKLYVYPIEMITIPVLFDDKPEIISFKVFKNPSLVVKEGLVKFVYTENFEKSIQDANYRISGSKMKNPASLSDLNTFFDVESLAKIKAHKYSNFEYDIVREYDVGGKYYLHAQDKIGQLSEN